MNKDLCKLDGKNCDVLPDCTCRHNYKPWVKGVTTIFPCEKAICASCQKEFKPTKEELDFLHKIQEDNIQIDEDGVERKVFNLICSECYNRQWKIRIFKTEKDRKKATSSRF